MVSFDSDPAAPTAAMPCDAARVRRRFPALFLHSPPRPFSRIMGPTSYNDLPAPGSYVPARCRLNSPSTPGTVLAQSAAAFGTQHGPSLWCLSTKTQRLPAATLRDAAQARRLLPAHCSCTVRRRWHASRVLAQVRGVFSHRSTGSHGCNAVPRRSSSLSSPGTVRAQFAAALVLIMGTRSCCPSTTAQLLPADTL